MHFQVFDFENFDFNLQVLTVGYWIGHDYNFNFNLQILTVGYWIGPDYPNLLLESDARISFCSRRSKAMMLCLQIYLKMVLHAKTENKQFS